ncbi:MAG: hypothetical protein WCP14_00040 [bacterium]
MEEGSNPGSEFLNKKYPNLQHAREVERASVIKADQTEDKPYTGDERIQAYLDRLVGIVFNSDPAKRERGERLLRRMLFDKEILDEEEIPDAYFENQQRLARERGQGDVEITAAVKHEAAEMIRVDQEASLGRWLDYLKSDDARYPTWFKYFAIRSVLSMSEYDKDQHSFGKRSKTTTKPYPDLNHEALAYVYDAVQKQREGENFPEDEELSRLLRGANFTKLYAYAIEKITPASPETREETEGEWIKFDQGTDPRKLTATLQGHATGWCVAGEGMAQSYLSGGDFFVYYTKDGSGKYTIPRAAIAITDGQVTEVRGVTESQNMEGSIAEIAKAKYETLPGGEKFEKKDSDMKRLTELDRKSKDDEELTKEDLIFLYEIDERIEGFGYETDPRVLEIIRQRDERADLSFITGYAPEEISISSSGALAGGIKFHYGNLDLRRFESLFSISLPQRVGGDLLLDGIVSSESLTLPHEVGGNLSIPKLKSAKNLILPEKIGGSLYLPGITSAKGLNLPQTIGGGLHLGGLTSAEGLILPQKIRGGLILKGLASAEGLTLPEEVGDHLNLAGLTSVEGLALPQKIGGSLYLDGLSSAEGLTLPREIDGYLSLERLVTAKGLTLPEKVDGPLYMQSLSSTEGLILPQEIGGNLHLGSLTSAEGLKFPQEIGGGLYLGGLTSAKGLVLPEKVGDYLNLRFLTLAKGLALPREIGGALVLYNLGSTEGLILPQVVGGDIYLESLSTTEGLNLPREVGGNIYLEGLWSSEGLILPQKLGGEVITDSALHVT